MRFEARLSDFQKVIVEKGFWTGKTEVRLDNVIIGKFFGNSKEPLIFKFKDGSDGSLEVKHEILDPMPQLLFNGRDLLASERFPPAQTAIICLPALLILQLGAIPAVVGIGSVYLNYFVARNSKLRPPIRWTVIGSVPVVGFIVLAAFSSLVWGDVESKKPRSQKRAQQPSQPQPKYEDPPEWFMRKPSEAQLEAERYTREGK